MMGKKILVDVEKAKKTLGVPLTYYSRKYADAYIIGEWKYDQFKVEYPNGRQRVVGLDAVACECESGLMYHDTNEEWFCPFCHEI